MELRLREIDCTDADAYDEIGASQFKSMKRSLISLENHVGSKADSGTRKRKASGESRHHSTRNEGLSRIMGDTKERVDPNFEVTSCSNEQCMQLTTSFMVEEIKILASIWRKQMLRTRRINEDEDSSPANIQWGPVLWASEADTRTLLFHQLRTDLAIANLTSRL
jgi:hypothetical protein